MKIAALYAPVGTADQSCDPQLAGLRRYAKQRQFPRVAPHKFGKSLPFLMAIV
jgi:hypothetical protein